MELEIKLELLDAATVVIPQAFENSRGLLMKRFHAARSKSQEQSCEFAKSIGFDPVKRVLKSAHSQYDPPMDMLMPLTGPLPEGQDASSPLAGLQDERKNWKH